MILVHLKSYNLLHPSHKFPTSAKYGRPHFGQIASSSLSTVSSTSTNSNLSNKSFSCSNLPLLIKVLSLSFHFFSLSLTASLFLFLQFLSLSLSFFSHSLFLKFMSFNFTLFLLLSLKSFSTSTDVLASMVAQVYLTSFTPVNFLSNFKKAGVYPFNPSGLDDQQLASSTSNGEANPY